MKQVFVLLALFLFAKTAFPQTTYNMKIKQGTVTAYSQTSAIDEITFENSVSFTCGNPVLYGGEIYPTVLIGSQCWLARNLNIGTRIDATTAQANNSIIEKYCYSDREQNCATLGGLYQWAEAVKYTNGATNTASPSPAFSGSVQGICPDSWHIPSKAEYAALQAEVASAASLKAAGQISQSQYASGTSGFGLILAGLYSNNTSSYTGINVYGIQTTSSDSNATNAYRFTVDHLNAASSTENLKINAYSVRCIKNFICGDNLVYGGLTYHTVAVGSQCWMKENLNVGTMVAVGTDQTNNSTIEKYCYGGDESNCTTYGGLYQWAEAVQYLNGVTNTTSPPTPFSGNVQGICPAGWHLPNYYELIALKNYVNSSSNALKAVGQGSGSGAGTNTSGFTALLAGFRFSAGFYDLGSSLFLLSSQEENLITGIQLGMNGSNNIATVYREFAKTFGFSARCLKD